MNRAIKSGKQRRAEIKAARVARVAAREARAYIDPRFLLDAAGAPCDPRRLAQDNSYDTPVFVSRGCYVDVRFTCVDCGAEGVWTAGRQKWWYEKAKGGVWTRANRCRVCRAKRRAARDAARAASIAGWLRKLAAMAARGAK